MSSPTQWTWVWASSGSWWWTGRTGVLQSMGSQRVGHDWATELNWTELNWGFVGLTYMLDLQRCSRNGTHSYVWELLYYKSGHLICFPFPSDRTCAQLGYSFLALSSLGSQGQDDADEMKLFFLPFLCIILRLFVPPSYLFYFILFIVFFLLN